VKFDIRAILWLMALIGASLWLFDFSIGFDKLPDILCGFAWNQKRASDGLVPGWQAIGAILGLFARIALLVLIILGFGKLFDYVRGNK
jgi:hypothetical protein